MLSRLGIPPVSFICRRASCTTHPITTTTTSGSSSTRIRGFVTEAENNSTSGEEKNRLATIRLYRVLQRTCRSFPVETEQDPILLQPALKLQDWSRHSIFTPPSPTTIQELFRLFYVIIDEADDWSMGEPSSIDDWFFEVAGKTDESELPPMTTMTCWTSSRQLQEAVRTAFRVSYNSDIASPANLRAWAIRAVQILQEQQALWSNSSCQTTEGVRVTATSRFIGTTSPTAVSSLPPVEMAAILAIKYRFAYRIRVENVSDQSVQLLGRYWGITELTKDGKEDDDPSEKVVVDTPDTGAVGQQPVLRPGQVFEYMSGTDLSSSRGVMSGHFYMARVPNETRSEKKETIVKELEEGDKFNVAVAPFPLEATLS